MSMEDEVEQTWLGLKVKALPVYVSTTGRVGSAAHVRSCQHSELVGYYTKAVSLTEFRDDVYSVFCKLMRG